MRTTVNLFFFFLGESCTDGWIVHYSYGVEDAEYAISQLAQTTMRSEIGQLTLDHVLKERAMLNTNITQAINEAAQAWGVTCLRYEIRDIHAPDGVVEAMHRQVTAERSKRAEILDSEGQRQSAINIAEGRKQSVILASEADRMVKLMRFGRRLRPPRRLLRLWLRLSRLARRTHTEL